MVICSANGALRKTDALPQSSVIWRKCPLAQLSKWPLADARIVGASALALTLALALAEIGSSQLELGSLGLGVYGIDVVCS